MITSKENAKIKQIIKLRRANKRKKEGLIVVEGRKEIGLALKAGLKIEELYFSQELAKNSKFIKQKCSIEEVSKEVFEKISIRDNPDGFLALVKPFWLTLDKTKLPKMPLIAVLEAVEKPGNLGAILRTCDATGVDLVILANPQTDIYNHNVIRASLGTVFTNKIITEKDSQKVVDWLKLNKISIFAATPDANLKFTDCDYKTGTAVVIGTEHAGLSNVWLQNADQKILIPMKGKIDSLNASVSTALVLYEVLRQREF